MSPNLGGFATGIGAGTGVSHGWTVNGRDLTVIQLGQAEDCSSSSKPGNAPEEEFVDDFLDDESDHGRLNELLDRPTFLSATLVARFENMVSDPVWRLCERVVVCMADCVTVLEEASGWRRQDIPGI